MKATVWTSWDTKASDPDSGKPKCIFIGDIAVVPREGELIVLREGFGAEVVRAVLYDFVTSEIEISVRSIDRDNEYGPCLRLTSDQQMP